MNPSYVRLAVSGNEMCDRVEEGDVPRKGERTMSGEQACALHLLKEVVLNHSACCWLKQV